MLRGTVQQFYNDVKQAALSTPSGYAQKTSCAIFNAALTQAKKAAPDDPLLASIQQADDGNTGYAELLIMTGALLSCLPEAEEPPKLAPPHLGPL